MVTYNYAKAMGYIIRMRTERDIKNMTNLYIKEEGTDNIGRALYKCWDKYGDRSCFNVRRGTYCQVEYYEELNKTIINFGSLRPEKITVDW